MSIVNTFLKLVLFFLIVTGSTHQIYAADIFKYYDACRILLGDKSITAQSAAAKAIQTGSLIGIDTESQWIIKAIHSLQGLNSERILKLTNSEDVHYFINYGFGEHTSNGGINIEIMSKRRKSNVNECKGIGAPTIIDVKRELQKNTLAIVSNPEFQSNFRQLEKNLNEHERNHYNIDTQKRCKTQKNNRCCVCDS